MATGTRVVTVRPMSEEDISEVLRIDRELVGERRVLTYADPLESYIGGDLSASWVAEADNKVVGFILCRIVRPELGTLGGAWIELLGVDPDYQHVSVGRQLISQVMDYCRKERLDRIAIIVSRHDDVFREFFTRLGFKQGEAINFTLRLED